MLLEAVGNSNIAYTYDNNDNQLPMTASTGTTTRTYDELNRAKTKIVPKFGTMTFMYDITSSISIGSYAETSTDPKNNVTTKVYDKVGRLTKVTADNKNTNYAYYDNGNQQSVTTDGVSSENYTYDGNNHISSLINKKADGTVIDSYTYTYDAAGNQISKVDPKGTTNYEYDVLNRLSKVTEPSGKVTTYTFDASGNRLTQNVTTGSGIEVTNYSYNDQNRLQKVITTYTDRSTATTNYTYDNNGNLIYTGKETTKVAGSNQTTGSGIILAGTDTNPDGVSVSYYQYDDFNQLNKAMSNGQTDTYTYNGDGLRVEKNVSGKVTRYLYEGDKVVLETDGTGSQTAKNVYGINLITRNASGQSAYYLYNGHADVVALNDASGNSLATYYYDAFGNILSQTGSFNNNNTYAGYQYDSETGLYYLNSRMYDPITARFIQEDDPSYGDANDPLSLNLYTYCHNEPIMYDDPSGNRESIVDDSDVGMITYDNHTGNIEVAQTGLILAKTVIVTSTPSADSNVAVTTSLTTTYTTNAITGKAGQVTAVIVAPVTTNTNTGVTTVNTTVEKIVPTSATQSTITTSVIKSTSTPNGTTYSAPATVSTVKVSGGTSSIDTTGNYNAAYYGSNSSNGYQGTSKTANSQITMSVTSRGVPVAINTANAPDAYQTGLAIGSAFIAYDLVVGTVDLIAYYKMTRGAVAEADLTAMEAAETERLIITEKDGIKYVDGNRPVKINQGQQDKHIVDTHNYNQAIAAGQPRSILSADPNELLNEYAGTGQKINDYKERIDFGKTIGKFYDAVTKKYIDTTKAIITYSKDGAHIIPARP